MEEAAMEILKGLGYKSITQLNIRNENGTKIAYAGHLALYMGKPEEVLASATRLRELGDPNMRFVADGVTKEHIGWYLAARG